MSMWHAARKLLNLFLTGIEVLFTILFWLALLPEYPVSGGARLRICTDPCAEPGDRVLVRGDGFVLLERASVAGSG